MIVYDVTYRDRDDREVTERLYLHDRVAEGQRQEVITAVLTKVYGPVTFVRAVLVEEGP